MTIIIENEYEGKLDIAYETIAKEVIEAVLAYEDCPYESQVSLVLTGNKEIQEVNCSFRHIDQVTDVLSFPMISFLSPADYTILEAVGGDSFDPDTGELLLGDIMIAVPRMQEQANTYGHSEKREYAFLLAHSVLHLLGYDHMVPEEAAQMEKKQEEILTTLNITR